MSQKERWASKLGLVLAMAGNAVGLGNFLRFPAQAAKNGGGAFLIPYLVSLLVVGIPLMWVEWTMGRYGGSKGHHSAPGIFQSMSKSPFWRYFGVLGLVTCLGVSSYYLYIQSWCLVYSGYSLVGGFGGMESVEQVGTFFDGLTGTRPDSILAISKWGLVFFFICIAINIGVLSRGIAGGIELVAKIGMPILIVFAAILAVRGLLSDPASDPKVQYSPLVGLNFVWEPKLHSLSNPAVWLAAAGQIFFTLSIGMGSIHCYASYLRENEDVVLTGATTAWTNELCEVILGGTILLPIAVSYIGLQAVQDSVSGGSGFGLGFMVLPTLFNNWGVFAPVAGFMWFGLLFFAAITSSLAMGQPIMAFLQDEFGLSRNRAAVALGGMILALAVPVAIFHEKSVNADLDYWVGTFGLVVFALGEIILFGWVFGMDRGWAEMMKGAEMRVPRAFYYITKYVTPTFLSVILLAYIFQPAAGWDGYYKAWTASGPMPAWDWSGDGMIGRLLHRDIVPEAGSTPEHVRFLDQVRMIRNLDRLALVAIFVTFSVLVHRAWKKNRNTKEAAA